MKVKNVWSFPVIRDWIFTVPHLDKLFAQSTRWIYSCISRWCLNCLCSYPSGENSKLSLNQAYRTANFNAMLPTKDLGILALHSIIRKLSAKQEVFSFSHWKLSFILDFKNLAKVDDVNGDRPNMVLLMRPQLCCLKHFLSRDPTCVVTKSKKGSSLLIHFNS